MDIQINDLSLVCFLLLDMSDYQLSNEDQEALEKFTKFFLVKSAQIIVQSRLGDKRTTKSKPVCSGTDWFHLSIKDIPEVTIHSKTCLGNAQNLPINPPHRPFCVEISLSTCGREIIPLETWCISFDDSISDPTQRVRFTIYNRMSTVLRSLVVCTRATPSYQLSRRQSPEKYIICYKMYSGEPIVSHLGEHYAKKTIGSIVTPIGRFVLNVAYRTQLTIVSTPIDNGPMTQTNPLGLEMKDDHFVVDRQIHPIDEDSDAQIPSLQNNSVPKSSPIEMMKRRHTSCDSISSSHGTPEKIFYSKLRTAFNASFSRTNEHDFQFASLMDHDQPTSKQQFSPQIDFDNDTVPDDFILVEVKPYFGKSDSTDDLALFIRSCQQPPMLESFVVEPSLQETIDQLHDELCVFESKVEEFDQLVIDLDKQQKPTI